MLRRYASFDDGKRGVVMPRSGAVASASIGDAAQLVRRSQSPVAARGRSKAGGKMVAFLIVTRDPDARRTSSGNRGRASAQYSARPA